MGYWGWAASCCGSTSCLAAYAAAAAREERSNFVSMLETCRWTVFAEHEPVCDVLVAQPLGNQSKDLYLAPAQAGRVGGSFAGHGFYLAHEGGGGAGVLARAEAFEGGERGERLRLGDLRQGLDLRDQQPRARRFERHLEPGKLA